jgi:hypothetical protein
MKYLLVTAWHRVVIQQCQLQGTNTETVSRKTSQEDYLNIRNKYRGRWMMQVASTAEIRKVLKILVGKSP